MGGLNEASPDDLSLPVTGIDLLPASTDTSHNSPAKVHKRSRSEDPLETSNRPSKQRAGPHLSGVEIESIGPSRIDPKNDHGVAQPAPPFTLGLGTLQYNRAGEENDKASSLDGTQAAPLSISSEEEWRQKSIAAQRQGLLDHIAPKTQNGPWFEQNQWREFNMNRYVEFFFQCGNQDAGCRLISCTHEEQKIWRGQYRIGVKPGSCHWARSPEYYHVQCFEELSNLQSLDFLARFNHSSSGFYADPGAITIYCIWRQHLIKQAQEAAISNAITQDRRSTQELEPDAAANGSPLRVTGIGEFFNVLASEIETKQAHGQAVTATDVTAMMARYRVDKFLPLVDAQDFTIKPVEVLDKVLPNGERTWKFIDGDSDWQITDYIVEDEAAEEDAKSDEARDDRPQEPEQADKENYTNASENLPDFRHCLSRALSSWRLDTLLALEKDSRLGAQLQEMKKARAFTASDVFRIQELWEPGRRRIEGRLRSDVEDSDEINRQIREMRQNVPAGQGRYVLRRPDDLEE